MQANRYSTFTRAVELHRRGVLQPAMETYRQVLALEPDHVEALHLLGVAETQSGRVLVGMDLIDRSLRLNPDQPGALANRGNCLVALNRLEQAVAAYDAALRLSPDNVLAHHGRGNALAKGSRPAEALISFEKTLSLAPEFLPAVRGSIGALIQLGRYDEAIAQCDRALLRHPGQTDLVLIRGETLAQAGRLEECLLDMSRAAAFHPGSAPAHAGVGFALLNLRRPVEAIAAFDRSLSIDSQFKEALRGRGKALVDTDRFEEALACFEKLRALHPAAECGIGACLHRQLQVCDWFDYRQSAEQVQQAVDEGSPLEGLGGLFIAVDHSAARQHKWARQLVGRHRPRVAPLWNGERYEHERIRIAYVSADFLEAPTSRLLAGVFEAHDRRSFETYAFSLRDMDSDMSRRVRSAFEHFIFVDDRSDAEIAQMMRHMQIDIAVDLMGYTGLNRASIFAHRPAPVQVCYLGFPAGMGTIDMDYILADDYIIPHEQQKNYSEAVVYLPDGFQANDDKRAASTPAWSRSEAGLPDDAFVWAALHSSYKINPPLFEVWMRLMRAVPDSVLWLVGGQPSVERNLRREAVSRQVDPSRLVFAPVLPYAQHLARLPLADVCLDCFPYNGGATTSDALWAGVPVVTCSGDSYASRMSGSLLRALRLPGLIGQNFEDYENRALALAREPAHLLSVRENLATNVRSSPAFDTGRFALHLESAYRQMVARQLRGEPPSTLTISPASRRTPDC
ncbi:MAG TPA: tetratricopeptide repeat protein [Steroidobacteraceae bacterium]|jgi:predicted O-linked N-acetylglucosamine transferase (SPINDLY family)